METEEVVNHASLNSALKVHNVHAENLKKLAVGRRIENQNAVARIKVGVHGRLVKSGKASLGKSESCGCVGAGENLPKDSAFN